MATVLTVASRKGGVGKTTTAVGLAIAATRSPRHAGRPVLLVDTDRRASASEWLSDQPVAGIEVLEAPTDRLLGRFAEAEFDDDALVIVDTPNASDNPVLVAKAIGMADWIVIPARVGGLELSALAETIEDVTTAGKTYGVLLVATIAGSSSLVATVEQLERRGIPYLGRLPHRVGIQQAGFAPFNPTALACYASVLDRIFNEELVS